MIEHESPQPPPEPPSGAAPVPGSRLQAGSRPPRVGNAPGSSQVGVDSPTVLRGSSTDSKRAPALARAPAASLPRPGDVLGTFVLEEAIGAGGMGAVFRAHDATLDRQVALKLLPPDQVDDPEVVQRFYQEGRSAARLDHENIARVYSLGQDGPFHYIVFEYVDGETIRRRVDEHGPMAVAEAVDVTLQMAQALVHSSLRGVVHRDVKPSNIIITPEGRAKLVDMGLARRFERQSERGGLTQTGMTLGTFDYISPEQARDPRDVDVRSDLYSLGCTLFHMLSGQPPFPGGTVLQKLLQHQEEAPPDVRELNPAVPTALARVLDKLMAKDRDRRCQSPEQLVRDLLLVAGRAGMTLTHFETAPPHHDRPAWDRSLALPTLAGFVLLAAGLFYWGRELLDPSAPAPAAEYPSLSASRPPPALAPAPGLGAGPVGAAATAAPRKIDVRPGEDLAAVIAAAPHKAVVTLTEDGPYLLGSRPSGPRAGAAKDVTIRAEVGKRPVLRFAADARGGDRPPSSLLSFSRGRVAIEGLTFEAEGRALDDPVAAILLDDAALQLTGCSFRRPADTSAGPGLPAVRSRGGRPDPAAGDRPPAIVAAQCHFDPGAAAFDCEGPADVQLLDCTFGPGGTAIVLDDADAAAAGPRDVLIVRSSFMAGVAPVFQVRGSLARFQADDCVFAPADASASAVTSPRVLALVDNPRNLAWAGRSNLYGKFDVLLDVAGKPASEEAVRDFDRWRSDLREARSTLATAPVWESPDPARELALGREAPSRAFRVAAVDGVATPPGAQRGPFGTRILAAGPPPAAAASPTTAMTTAPAVEPVKAAPSPAPVPTAAELVAAAAARGRESSAAVAPAVAALVTTPDPPTMPPMATTDLSGGDEVAFPLAVAPSSRPDPTPAAAAEPPARAAEPAPDRTRALPAPALEVAIADEDVVRSAEQLRNMIAHHGPGGGVIHVAAGVDLELATLDFPAGSWTIAAEPGERRPRLRFHPSPFGSSSSTWTSLFNVQGGELKLRGLDVMIQDFDHQSMGRLAAVGLSAGSGLELVDCTISLVGQAPSHAVVAVLPVKPTAAPATGTAPPRPAVVRIRDGFLRTAGDAVAVASNQRLDCRLDNVIVAADGSLLRTQGGTAPVRDEPTLTLRLEHVLARAKGGLVHMESSVDEAELPLAQVDARDSVLSTGAEGSPLFRVDGRGRVEGLADRIRWTGENVAYHEISVYRVDDGGQTGVSPKRYTRTDWLNSFVARDEAPVLDVEFVDRKAPALPARALSPEALRLAPRAPLARKGPDYATIPAAPDADS
ncbi:serine/threonine-protein kinase [Paludisphaera mucosa]|uniref:Serine/threonine-protein kinase n=1 Tax=Paludisphaera mucosa TaxID=3030827 RepID=A0ABT6FCF3_9BACT|nr:serine/threonine-protein kinase [Paludisphaera mucosa]MDG3005234.1 serine/threonine-protein kinase [Paludisphaera mucosa]